jgi:hypothetical protein
VVGYCCWLLIYILLRLTAFLTGQRYKSNLILMALVLLILSINVGTAPQEYPKSNQIKSIILIAGSQEKYLTKPKLNQPTLRPANQINQFIYAQLAPFIIHESTEKNCPPCIGQRRFIKQFTPIDHQRFGTRAHRNKIYMRLYELRKMGTALRGDRALSTNNIMTEHAQTCLVDTCGNMEQSLMMASFQVTVQQDYQPTGYLRDFIRLVMDPKWDEPNPHNTSLPRFDQMD